MILKIIASFVNKKIFSFALSIWLPFSNQCLIVIPGTCKAENIEKHEEFKENFESYRQKLSLNSICV